MTYYPDEKADTEEELDEHLKAELQWEAEMRAEENALRAESSDPASGMIQAVSMLDTKLQKSLAREAALQQRLNEADQRLDDSAQRLSASENLLAACQADLERWQEAYGVAGDATWALLRRLQEHLAPQVTQHGSLRKS